MADVTKTNQIIQGGALTLANFAYSTSTAATIIYWSGVALFGTALLMSQRYPRWIGVMGLAAGGGMTLSVGLPKAFLGASAWTEGFGFQALAFLFLLWTIMLGVLLWRNSDKHTLV